MPNNLPEAEIKLIAERAAEKAIERVYTQIGRSVVGKVIWLIGVIAVAAVVLFSGQNLLSK